MKGGPFKHIKGIKTKGKKKMKKKTKEILEILKGFMMNSELKNHTAEIVLYKKVIATL